MIKLSKESRRYIVIGLSVYILEILIIAIAQYLGSSPEWAVAISFWVGLFASFGLQKLVTFQDKRMHHKVIFKQFGLFCLLVLFNFGFTLLMVKLLKPFMPAVLIRTLAIAMTTCWNFLLYKKGIFKAEVNIVY